VIARETHRRVSPSEPFFPGDHLRDGIASTICSATDLDRVRERRQRTRRELRDDAFSISAGDSRGAAAAEFQSMYLRPRSVTTTADRAREVRQRRVRVVVKRAQARGDLAPSQAEARARDELGGAVEIFVHGDWYVPSGGIVASCATASVVSVSLW
jgi:hypothetical protein